MSEELFPRIQLVYEAVEVGDFDAAIKAAEPLDPEIIWVPPPDVPDTQHVYRGREAMKNRMIEINEPFENRESELVEFIEAGNRAFAHARLKGHGKGSKAPIV